LGHVSSAKVDSNRDATTQLVRRSVPPPPVDTNDTNLFEDFFIDPANNFAFCAIAKNAVSQWKTVLRNVMENRTSRGFSGPDYSLDESSLARHGVEQAKKILESRHSTVAIMVRDPLARFASAFLGKCFFQQLPQSRVPETKSPKRKSNILSTSRGVYINATCKCFRY
jgi:hypothetical protein